MLRLGSVKEQSILGIALMYHSLRKPRGYGEDMVIDKILIKKYLIKVWIGT